MQSSLELSGQTLSGRVVPLAWFRPVQSVAKPLCAATDCDDYPSSLANPVVATRRRALLAEPHMHPLADYVRVLNTHGRGYVPDFDPLDGGIHARLLLLLEKPGPKTFPPFGSGFVSRNTDDPTARAIHVFMLQAGVPRHGVALWNTVPWWNGTTAMTGQEKRLGAPELRSLLPFLPALRGVILAGHAAW